MPGTSAPAANRELATQWAAVLGRLEVELNRHNFTTWFKGTRPLRLEGSTLVVAASSRNACAWLNEKMLLLVARAMEQSFPAGTEVRFVAPDEPAAAAVTAEEPSEGPRGYVIGKVNCSYTFDDYVQAEGNRLAHQVCLDLAHRKETRFNPVVIFGSPGMGKSHLLHAMACEVERRGGVVVLLTAEEFVNRYMDAYRGKRLPQFHAEMRAADLVIIDDLQQITAREGSQHELVETFEAVTNAGGAIAVASEQDPMELVLVERLKSRLSMGITCHVRPFARDERREFIERHARRHRVSLPTWAIDRIAANEVPSVRVLMGAVNAAITLERNQILDIARLDEQLARVVVADARCESSGERELLERIARHFAVKLEDLLGRTAGNAEKDARAVAVAALQKRGRSLTQIKAEFDGRDKGTLSVLGKKGRELLEADEGLRALVG